MLHLEHRGGLEHEFPLAVLNEQHIAGRDAEARALAQARDTTADPLETLDRLETIVDLCSERSGYAELSRDGLLRFPRRP